MEISRYVMTRRNTAHDVYFVRVIGPIEFKNHQPIRRHGKLLRQMSAVDEVSCCLTLEEITSLAVWSPGSAEEAVRK